jgi:hypothetical protein
MRIFAGFWGPPDFLDRLGQETADRAQERKNTAAIAKDQKSSP